MLGTYPLVVNLRLRTILSERGGGVTIFKFNTVYIGSGLLLHYTLKVLIESFVTVPSNCRLRLHFSPFFGSRLHRHINIYKKNKKS